MGLLRHTTSFFDERNSRSPCCLSFDIILYLFSFPSLATKIYSAFIYQSCSWLKIHLHIHIMEPILEKEKDTTSAQHGEQICTICPKCQLEPLGDIILDLYHLTNFASFRLRRKKVVFFSFFFNFLCDVNLLSFLLFYKYRKIIINHCTVAESIQYHKAL